MAGPFQLIADGAIELRLDVDERHLLSTLATGLAGMLEPPTLQDPLGLGILADAGLSPDPVIARLLPDAYADADDAREFRRFTEHALRTRKHDHLRAVVAMLHTEADPLLLDADAAQALLAGLNDLRLAIGTRMGIGDDDASEPLGPVIALYDWLTWLQDALVTAISDDADTLPM